MTSPYYQFGYAPRYVYQWNAGQGGVLGARAPHQLGMADMLESGYGDAMYQPYPALKKYQTCATRVQMPCMLRAGASAQLAGLGASEIYSLVPRPPQPGVGDWPLVRKQGFEPEALAGFWSGLSDNEKRVAYLAIGGAVAWWWFRRRRRGRRNPWAVTSSTRGVTGRLVFRRKKDAQAYAAERRESGNRASVAPYRLRRKRRR